VSQFLTKQTKTKFKSKEYSMTKPLEIVHTDLCGPMRIKGLNGEQYFMLFIDDYKRMTIVLFLKKKSEAFEHFNIYKEMVEIEKYLKIKCLRSSNGIFFGEHGIKRKLLASKTPKQNGVVERNSMTVQEMARTMLKDSKLGDIFWAHEVHTMVHILNKGMLRSNSDNTQYELWKGR
jgi:hypothetical protein